MCGWGGGVHLCHNRCKDCPDRLDYIGQNVTLVRFGLVFG